MKSILCFLMIVSLSAQASFKKNYPIKIVPKVIYGTDDRNDVYESSDSLMRELSRSTAAQIFNENLIQSGDTFSIKAKTLQEWGGICSNERFSNQPAAANCSGFLVSSDILITAGHCIYAAGDCENHAWVFDYANSTDEKSAFIFHKDQIYRCTKIIAREKNSETMNDYAILKLDRPVTGRAALKFRTAGKVDDDAVFTVIGHPSGLPTKIACAANMRDNSNPVFFTTNSDTYGRNSGSAVVDSRTGIVEGILVRGDQDYTQSPTAKCKVSVYHDQNAGRGEDVTRITNLLKYLRKTH